ncbi:hypothetical protein HK096_008878, partial [Nowakowskiella sp. JEL0078]
MQSLTKLISNIKNAESLVDAEENSVEMFITGNNGWRLRRGGGIVLSVISNEMLTNSGDPVTKQMYSHLLSKCFVPYLSMLENWIHTGVVAADNTDEFMIVEKKGMTPEQLRDDFSDVYWEQRYTLKEDVIPVFLRPFKEKILLAGKYVNVIKECGISVEELEISKAEGEESLSQRHANTGGVTGEILKAVDGVKFLNNIEIAYKFSNQRLLKVLFEEHQLIPRLRLTHYRSMKHFFFLYQSDFLTPFLDLVRKELVKPKPEISLEKLRRSFELVVRNSASVSGSDPYKDAVVVELSRFSLFQQLLRIMSVVGVDYGGNQNISQDKDFEVGPSGLLTGFDALMLGYTVKFPLSLIINKKALTKYQLIFRHLFTCKHIESLLGLSWRDQGKSRLYQSSTHRFTRSGKTGTPKILSIDEKEDEREKNEESYFMARVCALRARMMNFVQQFLYYECFE